ncbi:J domain-containing protein [Ciceribacter sp. L1K23]|uniref:DnaJ C-terminal domain-containing protein n=1 Tax=Ciceribacter sp. L1K23 TaxID=2820276 RepID=UPI001B8460AD|nr:DnaJ C-terminal domain-containing protein [Ciceribacter sp. L1K23]MBR0556710.1 J domain-containing protein [Ciceribacter sp. L1K23]
MRDPYSILGVKRDADAEEIKAAWRAKAKSVHPDQNRDDPHATQRFAEVGRAYEVLKDPSKRSRYDKQRLMAEARAREQTIMQQREAAREAAERAKVAKANAERILAELAKAEAEKAKAEKATQAAMQAAQSSTQSPQSNGGQKPQPQAQAKPSAPKPEAPQAEKSESPEDVVSRIFGASPEAQAAAENMRRDGEGTQDAAEGEGTAENSGRTLGPFELITSLVRRLRGVQPPPEKAPDLFIDATVAIDDLINTVSITATLADGRDIRVPLDGGLTDGDTVRVKGQGLKLNGMQRGDVVVTLKVLKSEKFRADGLDIRTVLPVTLENAVLGCETSVEGPEGPIELTVPAWSGSDQILTIEGKGLPDGQGGRGNLLVEVRVLLWEKPDEKVTDLMRLMREGLFL